MSNELEDDTLLAPLRYKQPDALMLGGVLLKSRIGEGASGVVYSGVHTRLHLPMAVKVLKTPSPEALHSFLREARLTVSIDHPNLVRMFDINCDPVSGLHYLVMEYVEGCSAYQMLERSLAKRSKALSVPSALEIILSAANGMAVVHSLGFVHRDLKPDNLLIRSRDGIVKIADLGLASSHSVNADADHCLVGTVGFLSPEVIVGSPATPASDVYALGASMYELLTGWLPYGNAEENRYYELQLSAEPADPREYVPSLEPAVVAVIMKCLRRDPLERYQDCGELQRALIDLKVALPGNTSFLKSETALLNAPVVLVVDDNEGVLDLMKDALEASGFRPVCFKDPLEALRNLEKVQPEIAVLDRRMPRIDGVSLCRLLRQREGYQDFPVLMVSADNEHHSVLQAVRSGIDDYLSKPVNVHDVIVRVRLLSKLHRARRAKRQSTPSN